MANARPQLIGLLTDLHYDGGAQAMNRLYEAVATLNAGDVDVLVVMGDLVNATSENNARRLLREVSALCTAFHGPIHYMPGNHDLDHLSKAQFLEALGLAAGPPRFHFECGGYEMICIDCNFSPDSTPYDHGNFQWQEAGMPKEQLEWLRGRLTASLLPVIVISHQRIDKECTHAVRNYREVREMLSISGKVKTVFQGHNHEDDIQQIDGITYYTLGAHVDGAGPAVMRLTAKGIRLIRDFQAFETV